MNLTPSFLLLAALGGSIVAGGARGDTSSAPAPAMKSYVIIFRQGPFTFTDEVNARRQREIVAWAVKHNAAGHRLEPRAVEPDMRRPGVAAATEGSGQWPIVALVFLEARDIDEAAAIAEDHPAKHYNVSTEVRPWVARKVPAAESPKTSGLDR